MAMTDCRYFNGYKPCGKSNHCDPRCPQLNVPTSRVLVIHLGALGAVLRSTALLAAIHRKFPGCHLTWLTSRPADQLLQFNPLIDRILTSSGDDLLQLEALEFDIAIVIDKSLTAAGLLKRTRADFVYGFQANLRTGAILPATEAASELWEIGLSDHKKFNLNQKPETQLIHEACELGPWRRDEYLLNLTDREQLEVSTRRKDWSRPGQLVIGINTGCSGVIPYKKLSINKHRELIAKLDEAFDCRVVLLGGKEDEVRNQRIAHGMKCVQSSTGAGLRDGILSVAACDVVISGDSLGMHMAIALKKWTVAWFGPTVASEIDLYGRGEAVLSDAACGPCWKRSCQKNVMCYDLVAVDKLVGGVRRFLQAADLNIRAGDDSWKQTKQQTKQQTEQQTKSQLEDQLNSKPDPKTL